MVIIFILNAINVLIIKELPSGREADYSTPTSAEVKNTWKYAHTPSYIFIA
jgi:hypothetical protein